MIAFSAACAACLTTLCLGFIAGVLIARWAVKSGWDEGPDGE